MIKEKTEELRRYLLENTNPITIDPDKILQLCQEGADVSQVGTPHKPFSLVQYIADSCSKKLSSVDPIWYARVLSHIDTKEPQSGQWATQELVILKQVRKGYPIDPLSFKTLMEVGGKPSVNMLLEQNQNSISFLTVILCCRQHGTYTKEDWSKLYAELDKQPYLESEAIKQLVESFRDTPTDSVKYYEPTVVDIKKAKTEAEFCRSLRHAWSLLTKCATDVTKYAFNLGIQDPKFVHHILANHSKNIGIKQAVLDYIQGMSPDIKRQIIEEGLKKGTKLNIFLAKHSHPLSSGQTKSIKALEEMKAKLDQEEPEKQDTSSYTKAMISDSTTHYKDHLDNMFGYEEDDEEDLNARL